MTVKQAIEKLSKLPPDVQLMVASQSHGGSVPLQDFQDLDSKSKEQPHWVDVVYCDDHEKARYGVRD